MKVFCCRNDQGFGGCLVLVAANTKEEAFLTAAMNDELSYLFDWCNDYGWIKPDGNANHCFSSTYPLNKWFEIEHLSTDFTSPQVIIEDHYSE